MRALHLSILSLALLSGIPGAPISGTSKAGASLSSSNSWSAFQTFTAGEGITQGQKLCWDASTCSKYFSSNGTALILTGLQLTLTDILNMPSLTVISWGTNLTISNGAGAYAGMGFGMPNGARNANFNGTLYHSVTAASNSGTGETTLDTYPANSFGNDATVAARGWHYKAAGTFAANGNTKTVRMKIGATDMLGAAFTGAMNGGSWIVECDAVRSTGTSAQITVCHYEASSATPVTGTKVSTAAIDTTATFNFTVTGQSGTASSDINFVYSHVDYVP